MTAVGTWSKAPISATARSESKLPRTTTEARQLDLQAEVLDNYLYGNAQRFFFERLSKAGLIRARAHSNLRSEFALLWPNQGRPRL